MKTYTRMIIRGNLKIFVSDHDDKNYTYELEHIKTHSPSGMNIGYCGSGPADTALSILTDCLDRKSAELFYEFFKSDFVAIWQPFGVICFQIHSTEIEKWMNDNFTYDLDSETIERKAVHGR